MLFLIVVLIENSDDIDYVQLVKANTPEQALDYFLTNNQNVNEGTEIVVSQPEVHNASMHRCTKGIVLKDNTYTVK